MLIANTVTYNAEAYIRPCIESALACCDRLVIVDGGSTDRTLSRIREMIAEDTRAVIVSMEPHTHRQRNEALRITRALWPEAEWMLWLDSDEILSDACISIRDHLDESFSCLGLIYHHLVYHLGQELAGHHNMPYKIVRLLPTLHWTDGWRDDGIRPCLQGIETDHGLLLPSPMAVFHYRMCLGIDRWWARSAMPHCIGEREDLDPRALVAARANCEILRGALDTKPLEQPHPTWLTCEWERVVGEELRHDGTPRRVVPES